MKKKEQKKNRIKGFSLVEMILVVAISAIIALAVGQVFLSGMRTTEKNKELQKEIEEGRSALEGMAKNIRMSKYTQKSSTGDSNILYMYNNSQSKCISYRFAYSRSSDENDEKTLQYSECSPSVDSEGKIEGEDNGTACGWNVSCDYASFVDLTTGKKTTGDFYIPSANRTSRKVGEQHIGRATIRMTVGTGTESEATLQTSVSFRDYEDILQ